MNIFFPKVTIPAVRSTVGLIISIIIFFAGCSTPPQVIKQDPVPASPKVSEKEKELAVQHFIDGSVEETKGDYARAIIEYHDALRYDKDAAVYFALAKCYSALGKHALAADMGREAVRLEPKELKYRLALADIFLRAYDIDNATAEHREILKIDSTRAESIYAIARLLQSTKPLQALEFYERFIRINGPEWDALLQMADIYSLQGSFEKSSSAIEQLLRIDPGNEALKKHLAEMWVRAGKYDKALEVFSNLLDRDSTNLEVRGALAGLHLHQGEWEKAKGQFEYILKKDSIPADTRFRIGMAYFIQLQKDSSLLISTAEQFDTFLKSFPSDWRSSSMELRGALAELYLEMGNWGKASEQFEFMVKSDSLNPEIRFRIAMAYFMQTQKDTLLVIPAREQFELLLSRTPKDWRPLYYLGILFVIEKEFDKALELFEKVVALKKENSDAWWYIGSILFDKKEYLLMEKKMKEGIAAAPLDARLHFLLGLTYSRTDRNTEAVQPLLRSAELDPKDVNTLSTLGMVYDALKHYKESDSTYERALRINPHYILVLNNYAYSLAERGEQLERAYVMSKESVEKDSLNPSYLDTFGWILFKTGRYAEARIYVQKAIEAGDASPVVFEHLGDIYARLGDADKAKEYWLKARSLGGDENLLGKKIGEGIIDR